MVFPSECDTALMDNRWISVTSFHGFIVVSGIRSFPETVLLHGQPSTEKKSLLEN